MESETIVEKGDGEDLLVVAEAPGEEGAEVTKRRMMPSPFILRGFCKIYVYVESQGR